MFLVFFCFFFWRGSGNHQEYILFPRLDEKHGMNCVDENCNIIHYIQLAQHNLAGIWRKSGILHYLQLANNDLALIW